MKEIEFYHVDTFTEDTFSGNPAGVCPLKEWLDEKTMQNIAFENNLPETAFYVKTKDSYEIRWFTPTTEVDLCGHATLASAFVELKLRNCGMKKISFGSKSGELHVSLKNDYLSLNFPSDKLTKYDIDASIIDPFKIIPVNALKGRSDILLEFESEKDIQQMDPDLELISQLDCRGVIVTAKGDECDFVSRFFGPQSGIDEDPVTGSAHTTLIPYWVKKLNRNVLKARQLSQRGGSLHCELINDRCIISGKAVLYLEGKILSNLF